MRVIECNICGETLAAATDEELQRQLQSHAQSSHPDAEFDQGRAREQVSSDAYEASDS